MKTLYPIFFILFSLFSTSVWTQNPDTLKKDYERLILYSAGIDAFYAEHVKTTRLDGYGENFSTPLQMQGISAFFHVQPVPKWKFGLAYTSAISRCAIDLHDKPPFDTVLSMQLSVIALDVQYLLMQKRDLHALWLTLRTGYLRTESDPYTYYDSLPGQFGYPDYISGHSVYSGEGKGAHARLNLRYALQLHQAVSLGLQAGVSANYIEHETTYTGSLSTPWWPGMYYTDEESFNVIQYFIHGGVDLTIHFPRKN